MSIKLANNAVTNLSAPMLSTDTTLSVTAGTGAKFPTLGVGDTHPLTLIRASDNAVEIMTATARSADTFTVTRAQEGTAALAFVAGDRVELRMTAGTFGSLPADQIHNSTAKATPVDADEIRLLDSTASYGSKKFTWANLRTTLFGLLGSMLNTAPSKATPVNADSLMIQDSASSNATSQLTWANLVTAIKSAVWSGWGTLISAGTPKATPVGADAIAIMDSASGNATATLSMTNLIAYLNSALSFISQAFGDGRYALGPQQVGVVMASNAVTISALNAVPLSFRNATLTNGALSTVNTPSANLVIPNGATLGSSNGVLSTIVIAELNNAGTREYAVCNLSGALELDEQNLISTTAMTAAATAANVWYSATPRTNVPYRIVAIFQSTQTTAGVWAAPASLIQPIFGESLIGYSKSFMGKSYHMTSIAVAGTYNYTNSSNELQFFSAWGSGSAGVTILQLTIGGVPVSQSSFGTGSGASQVNGSIPPGATATLTIGGSNFSAGGYGAMY